MSVQGFVWMGKQILVDLGLWPMLLSLLALLFVWTAIRFFFRR